MDSGFGKLLIVFSLVVTFRISFWWLLVGSDYVYSYLLTADSFVYTFCDRKPISFDFARKIRWNREFIFLLSACVSHLFCQSAGSVRHSRWNGKRLFAHRNIVFFPAVPYPKHIALVDCDERHYQDHSFRFSCN
jgi:hypothetical protein